MDTLYHIVGYLPHPREFINLGTAITEQKARQMADEIVAEYKKDHTLPMMYSILPCLIETTVFHGPVNHVGVAFGNVSVDKFEPVKSKITDEAYARRFI
jgi:hypothetical protein